MRVARRCTVIFILILCACFQTVSVCRRKCVVLRRLLAHTLPPLTTDANQSGLDTDTLQLDDA